MMRRRNDSQELLMKERVRKLCSFYREIQFYESLSPISRARVVRSLLYMCVGKKREHRTNRVRLFETAVDEGFGGGFHQRI